MSKLRKRLGGLAVLVGLALLLAVAWQLNERREIQRRARAELEGLSGAIDFLPPEEDAAIDSGEPPVDVEPRLAPGDLIGRILIADLGVDAVALEGIDLETLEGAAGHFPGTALPGEVGNSSFAAHRDSLFRGLRHVKPGQDVEVETAGAVYTYRVVETRVVEPTQVDVVDPRGGRDLTLITCYPFDYVGPAPRRFVVHARWVGEREKVPGAGRAASRQTAGS